MKSKLVKYIAVAVTALGLLSLGYGLGRGYESWSGAERHTHQWSEWEKPSAGPDATTAWVQFRYCTNCGLAEYRAVEQTR